MITKRWLVVRIGLILWVAVSIGLAVLISNVSCNADPRSGMTCLDLIWSAHPVFFGFGFLIAALAAIPVAIYLIFIPILLWARRHSAPNTVQED